MDLKNEEKKEQHMNKKNIGRNKMLSSYRTKALDTK